MSPYTQNVVDATNNEINRQGTLNKQQIDSQAAISHAYGGDRQAVADAMNDRNTQQTLANADANIYNTGYTNAAGTATSRLQGNQDAALRASGINLAGASGLANAGGAYTNANNGAVNGLLTAGGTQQTTNQNADTFDNNEYQNAYNSLYQRLQAMISATQYAPHDTLGTKDTTATTDSYSNPLLSLAGAGIGLAGLKTGGGATLGGSAIAGLLGLGSKTV